MTPQERLADIAAQLRNEKHVPTFTIREFLGWFNAQRRGYWIVQSIRSALDTTKLTTEPDFEAAYIDSPIRFALTLAEQTKPEIELGAEVIEPTGTGTVPGSLSEAPIYSDPTYRISKLAAANRVPVAVAPDSTLQEAVTIMLTNDFSQLPVMTNERDVKGIISWSSIGGRLALGKNGTLVREHMEPHQEMRAESSLFQAINTVGQHQYVLIRGKDNRITGIVTASDLSLQFQQLAEPFLLLGEIENHIRRILDDRFSAAELTDACDPADGDREVKSVANLSFGAYIRLLENPDRWKQVGLPIDRVTLKRSRETTGVCSPGAGHSPGVAPPVPRDSVPSAAPTAR
ncbi:MAG TPA: CBS domain-containing protein, partial [Anaeromyxobacteraceae bacterium]|nr:CBS domain-containing protein [Anaeromyxobacteraceae bacterium]